MWVETPTNPLLKVVDIAAIAELAHAEGVRVVVDNTFATPSLQRPVELGADLVVHSTTKYLGGHSDVVGGAVCCDAATTEQLRFLQNAVGAVPGPFDAWLTLRGIKTLGLRMRQHCANAQARRRDARGPPAPSLDVRYPGLPDHPQHDLAARQMARLRRDGLVPCRRRARAGHATSPRGPGCSSSPSPSAGSRA